jgi:hypothetical protein
MRTIGHEELKQREKRETCVPLSRGTSATLRWKHGEKQGHKEVSLCLIMGMH